MRIYYLRYKIIHMKSTLLILTSLLSLCLNAQIEHSLEFIDFGTLPPTEKHIYVSNNGWTGVNTDQFVKESKVYEDLNYMKTLNGNKYLLLVRNVLDLNSGEKYYVTTVTFNSKNVFDIWLTDIKMHYNLTKLPNENKWTVMDEDGFILIITKRRIKDIWVYVFEVIA